MTTKGDSIISDICWIAYFDTLGFRNLFSFFERTVGPHSSDVFARCYPEQIIRDLERSVYAANNSKCYLTVQPTRCKPKAPQVKVSCLWFSDSFVIFAPDDGSVDSFCRVKHASEEFFIKMIERNIPFRGALTNGEFYCDENKNIFFGMGLNDAYGYAEKQDWIGFVLTPRTSEGLRERTIDLSQYLNNYVEYDVPIREKAKEKLFAFRLHRYRNIEQTIRQMSSEAQGRYKQGCDIRKYNHTLDYISNTSKEAGDLSRMI